MLGINQFSFPDSVEAPEAMKLAKSIGYDCFEVCMTMSGAIKTAWDVANELGIASYENKYCNINSSEKDLLELKRIADDLGMRICSIGGVIPFMVYPLNSPDAGVRAKSREAVTRMIEAASILKADTVTVIPGGVTADVAYEDAYNWASEELIKLSEIAGTYRIALGIENVWNYFLYSPLEMKRFIDGAKSEWVGAYFDVGNALNFGFPEQWIHTLDKRIKKIHLKDFRLSVGTLAGFTNILDGDVNWPEVMKALKQIGYSGDLIVELIPSAKYNYLQTLEFAAKAVKRLWE